MIIIMILSCIHKITYKYIWWLYLLNHLNLLSHLSLTDIIWDWQKSISFSILQKGEFNFSGNKTFVHGDMAKKWQKYDLY